MKKNKELWVILVFLIWIGLFFAANLLAPQASFSARENRYLQTRPELTAASLFSGEFMQDYESYCSDQFVLRDRWVTVKARCEQLYGKKENNGIFLCADERLLEPFAAPSAYALSTRAEAVSALSDAVEAPVYLALVPGAEELYRELLPQGAPNDSERTVIQALYDSADSNSIDIFSALAARKDEDVFYRTDHHWTALGAYYAYQAICDAMELSAAPLTDYRPVTVSTDFYGTAYSSSGYTWIRPDSIQRFVDGEGITVERYDSSEPTIIGLYAPEKLMLKDKYTYYLGGNTPRLVIHGTDSEKPALLILRDSYSDSLAPFLIEHFSAIHLLDLRYYRDSVSEYVHENAIGSVLVLYSVKNFCSDSSVLLMED